MKMKKTMLFMLFILCVSLAYAEFKSDEDINMLGNIVYNASMINATEFFENGTGLVSESELATKLNLSGGVMTGDINMSANSINNVGSLTLNTSATFTGHVPSRMTWNSAEGTWDMESDINDTVGQMFYEDWLRVVNKQGATLDNCDPVYAFGIQGQRTTVKLANANDSSTAGIIGLVTVSTGILNNAEGIIVTDGTARSCDTSDLNVGIIYLNTSDGGLTNTEINGADGFNIVVGRVLNSHSTQGEIEVSIGTDVTDGVVVQNVYVRNNTIINNNLTVDNIIFDDEGHNLKIGSDVFNGITEESFVFNHPEEHVAGTIGFMVNQINNTMFWTQVGKNNSAGLLGNSWIIGENSVANSRFNNNMTLASDCLQWYDTFGMILRIVCDSSDGADWFSTGSGHVWDDFTVGDPNNMSSITIYGPLNNILNGFDANFFNGSIHPQTPVNFVSGFNQSQNVTLLNAVFPGTLNPFVNQQVDLGNWFVTSNILCDDDGCAEASGAGGGNVTMDATFSTENFNETLLTFTYSLVGLSGAEDFTVEINNGSGFEEIFTDTGSDILVNVGINLSETYWNKSSVTLRFTCNSLLITRICFVDTITVTGLAMIDTTANQSGFDSEICMSDGSRDANNDCNRGIRYNAETDQIIFSGTINATGTIVGGITGSGTSNTLTKWNTPTSLSDSIVSDDGSVLTITGDLDVNNSILFVNSTSGNVGIGVNIPTQKLDVNGNVNISGTLYYGILNGESDLNVNSSNSTTFWGNVSNFQSRWFFNLLNTLSFNETLLNATIDERDDEGVTSVAAGNGLDFSTITSTGSVVLGTPGSLNDSTSNSVTSTSHTHNIEDVYIKNYEDDVINANLTISGSNRLILNATSNACIFFNGSHILISNNASGVTC